MRLTVYKRPNLWLSMEITEEEWPELKEYVEENNIWYTLVLGRHEEN